MCVRAYVYCCLPLSLSLCVCVCVCVYSCLCVYESICLSVQNDVIVRLADNGARTVFSKHDFMTTKAQTKAS